MALPNPLEAFVWGPGGAAMTPDQIARQREIASALLNQAGDTSPVADWTQGAARVVNALGGVMKERRADKAEATNAEGSQSRIAALLGGMTGGGAAQFPDAPSGAGGAPVAAAGGVPPQDVATGGSPSYAPLAQGSNWLEYANQGATRNQPLNDKLTSALSFLPEMGVTMKVFSGGQDAEGPNRVGSHRHDHGNAGDVFFYKDGKQLNWADPKDRPIFEDIVRRGKAAGVTGFGAGDGYMQSGSMHLGFGAPSVWGAGGKGSNAPDWLRNAYNSPAQAGAAGSPALAAIEQVAPQQVASLDPAIGLPPQAPTPYAPNGAVPAPVEGAGFQVGGAATSTDAGNRVVQALINPQSMTGGAPMPMQGGQNSGVPIARGADAGVANGQQMVGTGRMMTGEDGITGSVTEPGDVQIAQAAPQDLSGGGFNQGMQAAIAQALSNPGASPQERQIATILLQQQMQQSDPGNQLDMRYKQAQIDALNAKAGGSAEEYGLSPVYGTDANGNTVLLQTSKSGKVNQPQIPDGVKIANGFEKVDLGTAWGVIDKRTGQMVQTLPKENYQEAFDKGKGGAEGKAVGEDNVQLPQTIATAEQSLANIDAVINDPNLDYAVGAAGVLPAIPGTAQAGTVARIEQLQGTAFLQAFEALKGGGQITEIEGKKATDAIARLSRAQKKEDFVDALSDLRAIVASGLDRARRKGGGAASGSEPAPTQRRLKFNPATGELE